MQDMKIEMVLLLCISNWIHAANGASGGQSDVGEDEEGFPRWQKTISVVNRTLEDIKRDYFCIEIPAASSNPTT